MISCATRSFSEKTLLRWLAITMYKDKWSLRRCPWLMRCRGGGFTVRTAYFYTTHETSPFYEIHFSSSLAHQMHHHFMHTSPPIPFYQDRGRKRIIFTEYFGVGMINIFLWGFSTRVYRDRSAIDGTCIKL